MDQARSRTLRSRSIAFVAAILVVITGSMFAPVHDAAWARDYPTWNDVASVRNDEAATKQRIAEIEALLVGLTAEAERTQADAIVKGDAWRVADDAYQDAAAKAENLAVQAEEADAKAPASELRAGQWAAQLVRSGGNGGDLTMTLLVNADGADNLLYGLGLSSKISGQAYAIYEAAILDRNTAQALTDQAGVARDELEVLKAAAEAAFAEAQAAAAAAAAIVAEQTANESTLRQQLVVLTERRAVVEADYLAGVQERIKAGASLDAGEISLSGWAKPAAGRITSSFGPRISPGGIGSTNHQGLDIGAGCGQNIFAAAAGTVTFAGWSGGYGNFVVVDHGGGLQTAYAHIIDGGILVGYGQQVAVGQNIAKVGTTGNSTGCHLHYEVRQGGRATDPRAFMAAQGIGW